MASGHSHDQATRRLALPFGLLWAPWLGLVGVAVAAGAFLVGGLWLSPDLDTRSRATQRWGPLGWLWWPYRRGLSHRSLFSHSPVIGTAGRLIYLALALLLAALVAQGLSALAAGSAPLRSGDLAAAAQTAAHRLASLWQQQRPLILAALLGLEASSWLHLLQDGDPMPRWPRPLRALARRLRPGSRRRRPQAGRRRFLPGRQRSQPGRQGGRSGRQN
jgi:uncharacterized metal-binding protein